MGPLEAVILIRFSGTYKRELIHAFEGEIRYQISLKFFIEVCQADVVQQEFDV
jgi:hypothetical protein